MSRGQARSPNFNCRRENKTAFRVRWRERYVSSSPLSVFLGFSYELAHRRRERETSRSTICVRYYHVGDHCFVKIIFETLLSAWPSTRVKQSLILTSEDQTEADKHAFPLKTKKKPVVRATGYGRNGEDDFVFSRNSTAGKSGKTYF